MNKGRKNYLVIWILLVILFNIICFVTPEEIDGLNKFSGGFWPGYVFITITFVIHLFFTWKVLGEEDSKQKILNMPVIVISFIELLIMVLIGGLCMALPFVPYWVGVIVCAVILVMSIVFSLTAKTVVENTYKSNQILNERVGLFREITAEAEILQSKASSKEAKSCAHKIIEALKYSDPLTDNRLMDDELNIRKNLRKIIEIISDEEKTQELMSKTETLLLMIEDRNTKMKAYKRNRI